MKARMSTNVVPFAWGTGYFTPEVAHSWDHNNVIVDRLPPDVTAAGLASEVDRIMERQGCRHRQVRVDERTGARLLAGFEALGWTVDHNLYMAHRRRADRRTPEGIAAEIDWPTLKPSTEIDVRRSPHATSEEVIRHLVDRKEVTALGTHLRHFGALVDGVVASYCDLFSDGTTAQVEEVTTLAEYRGRGLSRAVVGSAVDEARATGHDLVFLVADDLDWPKEFYARLGFDPIGKSFWFIRPAD